MTNKEFPPSVKRLDKARKEGQVAKSRLLSLAVSWWAFILALMVTFLWVRSRRLIQWSVETGVSPESALEGALWSVFAVSVVVLGAVGIGTVAICVIQTRGLLSLKVLVPDLQRLRGQGFGGRIKEGLIESALGIGRSTLLLLVVLPLLYGYSTTIQERLRLGAGYGVSSNNWGALEGLLFDTALRSGYTLTVFAVVGYGVSRWRFMRQYRMSLQELKDEFRESEGDPHLKSARKHEHEALLMSELRSRVKRAKVIVVRRNTTEHST
jgi:flagellar biosynthesis protein FlhB